MTKDEVKKILQWTVANYPHSQNLNMGPTVLLWEKMLSDIPYELAEKALIKVLSSAKFFPTVAEIREAAAEISNPLPMTAAEAWGEVIDAVRKFGHNRALEAMESLSPEVAVMVKRFGFTEICQSVEIGIIRGQFIKLWDSQAKREKELLVLPAPVRDLIQGVSERRLLDA